MRFRIQIYQKIHDYVELQFNLWVYGSCRTFQFWAWAHSSKFRQPTSG